MDMHSLDSKLIGTYSSDHKGRNSTRKMAQKRHPPKYQEELHNKRQEVRWIMQRPWNYALTPTHQSATT
jgi:hypothetical protein